jgi:hypothetical protein
MICLKIRTGDDVNRSPSLELWQRGKSYGAFRT